MNHSKLVGLSILSCSVLSACGTFRSDASPDIIYDDNATEAAALQVPPDLTDVSNSEQFVLPGNAGGPVSRNTLLPEFSSVSFERDGEQSWLAFDTTPEDIWPQLLAFVREEKYRVEQTEPVAGVIVTQWRAAADVEKGGLLQNLIGANEQFTRVAFRLERNGAGARLFARSQAASEDDVAQAATQSGDAAWPASSHDPESTSALLSRLLVFLGVEEQKARGILNQEQASFVLDDAVLLSNASGSQIIMHRGFLPSYNAMLAALDALSYQITSRDDGVGRIEFLDSDLSFAIDLTPEHVSEVRVSVSRTDGERLPGEQEQVVLQSLLEKIV